MWRTCFVLCCVVFIQLSTCSDLPKSTPSSPFQPDFELNVLAQSLMKGDHKFTSLSQLVSKVYGHVSTIFRSHVKDVKKFRESLPYPDSTGLWFQIMPLLQTSLIPNGQPFKFSSPCYQVNQVSATLADDKSHANISIQTSDPSSDGCEDFYMIATLQDFYLLSVKESLNFNYRWGLEFATAAEMDDIETLGFRVFRFQSSALETMFALMETIDLFYPEIVGPEVRPIDAEHNIEFLRTYTSFPFEDRQIQNVTIDPNSIQSGDFVGVTRLDGLDPMIIWGQGATLGHTTVAMRFNNSLYICESTVKDAYWPTDGVQCAPWDRWLQQAYEATFNFIHLPLSPAARKIFNETAATEFIQRSLGLPYGYHNFLFGWIDTPKDNFPCTPPNYTSCLQAEAAHCVSGLIDRVIPSLSYKMYNQALNFRINAQLETTAEIFQEARSLGIDFGTLITIPEQDEWVYNDGPSMVCDVFVCNVWKHAGLFGNLTDKFQCAELTPRDVVALAFFDTNMTRPSACVAADPDLPYCQLGGAYRLDLPGYNTKQPYPNMANNCPGVPPLYERPDNC